MKIILGYLLTPVFHLYYALLLVIFHPILVFNLFFFGDRSRKKTVDLLNYLLVKGLLLVGCNPKFFGLKKIPNDRPIIIVSNHQSMYDIPAVVWGFRKCYPKFISKIELAKNIPSVSHNLKHGKSALIDRKKGGQAVKEIFKLGKLIEENNYAACIFPEGTRSKTGQMKKFIPGGIHTLLRAAPSSIIVPFAIYGHSQLMYKGVFPLKFGQKITYTVLDPVEPGIHTIEEISSRVQASMKMVLDKEDKTKSK